MMACPTFMSHLSDESLSNSGHPRDCHVSYNLSHSTSHSNQSQFALQEGSDPLEIGEDGIRLRDVLFVWFCFCFFNFFLFISGIFKIFG